LVREERQGSIFTNKKRWIEFSKDGSILELMIKSKLTLMFYASEASPLPDYA